MYTLLCIKWMSNKKLLYKKIKEKKKKKKKEIRFVVIRSGVGKRGNWMKVVKGYKLTAVG